MLKSVLMDFSNAVLFCFGKTSDLNYVSLVTLPITYTNKEYKIVISQVTPTGTVITKAMSSGYPTETSFQACCSHQGFDAYYITLGI